MSVYTYLAALQEGLVFICHHDGRARVGEQRAGAGLEEGLAVRGGEEAAKGADVLSCGVVGGWVRGCMSGVECEREQRQLDPSMHAIRTPRARTHTCSRGSYSDKIWPSKWWGHSALSTPKSRRLRGM